MLQSFYTQTIQKDPRYLSTEKVDDINLLEPIFRQLVLGFIADAAAIGKTCKVIETYRSQTRQELLYQHGATQLEHVGLHHYGLAADIGVVIGGSVTFKVDYSFFQGLAKKRGLIWGGDWGNPAIKHNSYDGDHLQRIKVSDQPKVFNGTWYPDKDYSINA